MNYSNTTKKGIILEKIKQLNLENANNKLIKLGYKCFKRNLKYLLKYKDNVELIVAEMNKNNRITNNINLNKDNLVENVKNNKNINEIYYKETSLDKKLSSNNKSLYNCTEYINYKNFINSKILTCCNISKLDINTVIIDANNLIFVNEISRKLWLLKRYEDAVIILSNTLYKNVLKFKNIINVLLIFDKISFNYSNTNVYNRDFSSTDNIIFERIIDKGLNIRFGVNFDIFSASPDYSSSDEMILNLINIDNRLSYNLKENKVLFVTSDLCLSENILDLGFKNIMKSKIFYNLLNSNPLNIYS